jgi:hypothetical protein
VYYAKLRLYISSLSCRYSFCNSTSLYLSSLCCLVLVCFISLLCFLFYFSLTHHFRLYCVFFFPLEFLIPSIPFMERFLLYWIKLNDAVDCTIIPMFFACFPNTKLPLKCIRTCMFIRKIADILINFNQILFKDDVTILIILIKHFLQKSVKDNCRLLVLITCLKFVYLDIIWSMNNRPVGCSSETCSHPIDMMIV